MTAEDYEPSITDGTPGQINDVPPHPRPPADTDLDAPAARHCWVVDGDDRQPGLLLDWRQRSDGQWEGYVVRQTPDGHVATWLRNDLLEPAEDPTTDG